MKLIIYIILASLIAHASAQDSKSIKIENLNEQKTKSSTEESQIQLALLYIKPGVNKFLEDVMLLPVFMKTKNGWELIKDTDQEEEWYLCHKNEAVALGKHLTIVDINKRKSIVKMVPQKKAIVTNQKDCGKFTSTIDPVLLQSDVDGDGIVEKVHYRKTKSTHFNEILFLESGNRSLRFKLDL